MGRKKPVLVPKLRYCPKCGEDLSPGPDVPLLSGVPIHCPLCDEDIASHRLRARPTHSSFQLLTLVWLLAPAMIYAAACWVDGGMPLMETAQTRLGKALALFSASFGPILLYAWSAHEMRRRGARLWWLLALPHSIALMIGNFTLAVLVGSAVAFWLPSPV